MRTLESSKSQSRIYDDLFWSGSMAIPSPPVAFLPSFGRHYPVLGWTHQSRRAMSSGGGARSSIAIVIHSMSGYAAVCLSTCTCCAFLGEVSRAAAASIVSSRPSVKQRGVGSLRRGRLDLLDPSEVDEKTVRVATYIEMFQKKDSLCPVRVT